MAYSNYALQMGPEAQVFISGHKPLMMMVQRRKGNAGKKPLTRVVRKAVVSKTRTSITEEERSVVMEIEEEEEEDTYRPIPDDPIEDYDDFPRTRVVTTRVPETKSKAKTSKPVYVDEIEDDSLSSRRPVVRGNGADTEAGRCYDAFKDLREQVSIASSTTSLLLRQSSSLRQMKVATTPTRS